jgi:hypothetical protein
MPGSVTAKLTAHVAYLGVWWCGAVPLWQQNVNVHHFITAPAATHLCCNANSLAAI